MADLGNILDSIFKPEWLTIVHGVEALAANGEAQLKTDLQAVQTELSTALSTAATAVGAAEAKVDATVNPIVDKGVQALGTALATSYPPIAPLVAAAEGEAEKLADAGTDAILLKVMTWAQGRLSDAAKAVAASNLANIVDGLTPP